MRDLEKLDLDLMDKVRVSSMAFLSSKGKINVVPMCFAPGQECIYVTTSVKAKKVGNLQRNGNTSLLIHDYVDDWGKLSYLMIKGRANMVQDDAEYSNAKALLDARYPQFESSWYPIRRETNAILRINMEKIVRWRSDIQK